MKLSILIHELQKIQKANIDLNVYVKDANGRPLNINDFEIGMVGNHGEFVDSKTVTSRNWDAILDSIAITTKWNN